MAPFEPELRAGLRELSVDLSDSQVEKLLAYAGLLNKWNRVYNLTALREPGQVVSHHLLDCAAVLGPLRRTAGSSAIRLLDVGSGGGLPGVVIAVAQPEAAIHCVDAVAKKAAFVQQVSAALGLPNLQGLHSRVEQVAGAYDVIASRAFSSLADFVSLSGHALAEQGVWMAMKGRYPADEVSGLPPDVELFHVEQLRVPGLDAERCLLWLRRRRA